MSQVSADRTADRGLYLLTITWTLTIIALVVAILRIYTCWRIIRRFRPDFFWACGTIIVLVVAQICLQVCVSFGFGKRYDSLQPKNASIAIEFNWIYTILDLFAIGLGKITVVVFLIQIRGSRSLTTWFLWFIGVSCMVVNIITIGLILNICHPVQKMWNPLIQGDCPGHQLDAYFAYFSGSWNAVFDVVLALYPITVFWKLQMAFRLKVGLCVLLGGGVIAGICSAVKTVEIAQLTHNVDLTYDTVNLLIWLSVEARTIFILSCIPPIRPFFDHFFGRATDRKSTKGSISLGFVSAPNKSLSRGTKSGVYNEISTKKAHENESVERILGTRDEVVVTTEFGFGREKNGSAPNVARREVVSTHSGCSHDASTRV